MGKCRCDNWNNTKRAPAHEAKRPQYLPADDLDVRHRRGHRMRKYRVEARWRRWNSSGEWGGWGTWRCYATLKGAQQALVALQGQGRRFIQYRAGWAT